MASDALEGPVPALSGRGQPVLDLLDRAIGAQTPLVRRNIARARLRNPEATPAEVIRTLERMYVSALAGTGAAVGGAAAAPAVGTGIALALSAGEPFSSIVLGRVAPFGIGAVIGGGANATVAALAVRAARRAFGQAPQSWPGTGPEPAPPAGGPRDQPS
ncbi:hypothetical protein L6E12_04015 [Actinokineospora sp. PR83]|uniref:hypothetical protein n=1 Tax=Actinokineospora sp. PR83 TaxID=2884908 RepID=UPI001F26CDEF|nr:hypothetical protein [Actinokineospora sp. PR83]MCG8914955.1 hypothetical protein [Actinokineospora sp. PR83]